MKTIAVGFVVVLGILASAVIFVFLPGRGVRNNTTKTVALAQTILVEFDVAMDSGSFRLLGAADDHLESLNLNRQIATALKARMPRSQRKYIYADGLFHDSWGTPL